MGENCIDKFIKDFQDVLEDENVSERFKNAYNGEWGFRTELMLGSGEDRKSGIIYKVLTKFYGYQLNQWLDRDKNIKQEVTFEQYNDCIVYKEFSGNWDDWYRGELYHDIIIEVENNIKQFSGTFSDLLRIQSKTKIGVFYYSLNSNKNRFLDERKKDISHALEYFTNKGFIEAEGTEYLFIFLPEQYRNIITDFIDSIFGLNLSIILDSQKMVNTERTIQTLKVI